MQNKSKDTLERISMTLPHSVLKQLDEMVESRGFANRSQAITEIINKELVDYNADKGDQIMTGTITLFYCNERAGLAAKISTIQREHIDEVISSLHVQLENNHTMEVILVQGPAVRLRAITNLLVSCKGVVTGKLTLTSILIPPLHPLINQE